MTKICSKCNVDKSLECFIFQKTRNSYRKDCKECCKKRNKSWVDKNKEILTVKRRLWLDKHREDNSIIYQNIKYANKKWRTENKEILQKKQKEYHSSNKEIINKKNYIRKKKRLSTDINFKLSERLRNRFYYAVRDGYKNGSAIRDLGCSIEELKQYLERKFTTEMTWENHGKVWHIDHIKPLCKFDLTDREQVKQACNYSNLQPLLVKDNLSKGGKYDGY